MFSFLSKTWSMFYSKPKKIVIIGLDAAGKTSLLYRIQKPENIKKNSILYYRSLCTEYNEFQFFSYDVGGNEKQALLWSKYLQGKDGIVFMIDSYDIERLDEVKEQFQLMIKNLTHIPLLVMANKQDMIGALKKEEIIELLDMNNIKDRKWNVVETSMANGKGIIESFDWLSETLLNS